MDKREVIASRGLRNVADQPLVVVPPAADVEADALPLDNAKAYVDVSQSPINGLAPAPSAAAPSGP